MPRSLAISMPAYNEEHTIEGVVKESFRILESITPDHEVVVVNDGSVDNTRLILDRMAGQFPRLTVIHHPKNLGFGQTLKDVFQKPQKSAVFFIPGDGQIRPSEIHRLLPALENADFILGWRHDRRDGMIRWLLSAIYNQAVSLRMGRVVHDVDSVALVKKEVIDAIHFENDSAFFHAEFLMETHRLGFRWTEIPIEHRPRISGHSTVFKRRVLLPALRDFFSYFLQRKAPPLSPRRPS